MRSLIFAGVVSGCGLVSDGQTGERGAVRFSLVHDYAASRDLTSPVAVGSTVLLSLQRPNGSTFTELELRVEAPDGHEVEAFPLGFSQYAVILDESGRHRLIATEPGSQIVDSLDIRAEEVDDIELEPTARVTTVRDDAGVTCTSIEEQPLRNVVLHQNQTMEMFVVPRARTGEPMIGLLALTASGPDSIELSSPIVGEGHTANTLIVDPIAEMPDTLEIVIEEEDRRIETPIAATNEQKVIACQS